MIHCSLYLSLYLSIYIYYPTDTRKGKTSGKAKLKDGKTEKHSGMKITTYEIKFHVAEDFGIPGAFVIKNRHKHKFFLQSATLGVSGFKIVHFDCNSWIYPIRNTKNHRLFFSNTVSHTLDCLTFHVFQMWSRSQSMLLCLELPPKGNT